MNYKDVLIHRTLIEKKLETSRISLSLDIELPSDDDLNIAITNIIEHQEQHLPDSFRCLLAFARHPEFKLIEALYNANLYTQFIRHLKLREFYNDILVIIGNIWYAAKGVKNDVFGDPELIEAMACYFDTRDETLQQCSLVLRCFANAVANIPSALEIIIDITKFNQIVDLLESNPKNIAFQDAAILFLRSISLTPNADIMNDFVFRIIKILPFNYQKTNDKAFSFLAQYFQEDAIYSQFITGDYLSIVQHCVNQCGPDGLLSYCRICSSLINHNNNSIIEPNFLEYLSRRAPLILLNQDGCYFINFLSQLLCIDITLFNQFFLLPLLEVYDQITFENRKLLSFLFSQYFLTLTAEDKLAFMNQGRLEILASAIPEEPQSIILLTNCFQSALDIDINITIQTMIDYDVCEELERFIKINPEDDDISILIVALLQRFHSIVDANQEEQF